MDGSKMRDKVGYAINKEDQAIKKRILPQKMVFSVEQSAIIGGIQSKKNKRHEIVTKTDSLNTIMAAESRTLTKNPKTQTSRKMLDHERRRIILLWVLSHKEIPGNIKADQAAKEALDEDISTTERYSQDDLKKWLTEEDLKKRDQRWKNKMKEKKPDVERKEDTKEKASETLSTEYTRATHGSKMEGVSNPLYPFCNTHLSVDHILWECKETEDQRTNMDMKKEEWNNG
jgi:hypothetical protein